MRVGKVFNHSIFVILMLVLVCFITVMIISMINLPDISTGINDETSNIVEINSNDVKLGKFGETMIEMLPDDLAFTVFMPSEEAFDQKLELRGNHKFDPEAWNNAYATVSHVLGFSTVPRKIYAGLIPGGKELSYESISGFQLYIFKDFDGVLVVNGVRAKQVDIKKGEVVVHIIDGVVMDAEFEQSVRPDEEEDHMTIQV